MYACHVHVHIISLTRGKLNRYNFHALEGCASVLCFAIFKDTCTKRIVCLRINEEIVVEA